MPLADRFIAAGEALGHRRRADFNGADPEGFGVRQATIRDGRRESTATVYLRPIRQRANLAIRTGMRADRLLFDGRRASGVRLVREDQAEDILARREVIVACGSYGSPALLQRSGIGDGPTLTAAGVEVRHPLAAVGENLQDHIVAPVQMRTRDVTAYGISWRVLPRLAWNLAQYAVSCTGPLASNIFEAAAFVRTRDDLERPDVQLIFMPMHRARTRLPLPIGHGYGILVGLLRPASRGRVTIASPNPHAPPLIDPRFFSDPADLPPLLAGMALARWLFASAPFAKFDAEECLPGAAVTDRDALTAYIRDNAVTVHHPVGTCRMGSDQESVVDPALRVRGIDALRVVDASIMPTIIAGNTAAPVVAIAEKAADLILGIPAPAPLHPHPASTEKIMANLVIVRFYVKPGAEADVEAILRNMVVETRKEPGCLLYDLHKATTATGQTFFCLLERYRDDEALLAHRDNDYYRAYRATIMSHLSDPIDVAILDSVDALT